MAIAEDMKLSQFDLVDCPAGNLTDVVYKAAVPNSQNVIDENNYKRRQQQLLLEEQQKQQQQYQTLHQQYNQQQQQQHHHQRQQDVAGKNTKIVTTFAGPAAKNQHVRGTGIQLDKVAFGGSKSGVRMETAHTCK